MSQDTLNFDYIRPYNDSEAVEAFKRIVKDSRLADISAFLFPGMPTNNLEGLIASLKGVDDYQLKLMTKVVNTILEKTSTSLTYSGLDLTQDFQKHLLISNHRDIILDPAIVQIIFYRNSVPTTEIAVGDNLISSQFVEDIIRSNRMIKVVRGGTPREIYSSSLLLSSYIRKKIVGGECSIWIAQRNGRAKNGEDRTEQGLLKMLDMSGGKDFVKNFAELSIVPLSISYQFEPCDFLKARELYISKRQKYVKAPGEDLNSIITGVTQYKGGIHLHFCSKLSDDDIEGCMNFDKNERFKALCSLMDNKINSSYKLWNNNYIAYDLLNNNSNNAIHYTEDEKHEFIAYFEKGLSKIVEKAPEIDYSELKEIFLSIYAAPVRS